MLGRSARVEPVPGEVIEILTTRDRIFELGTLPQSGSALRVMRIPDYLPRGFVFFAQAETTQPGGALSRTNSVPVVVR